ncbi:HutD family protein [Arthrobacter sp. GMC3]|uniref:HutD/Ves family protein n=1 Tax=Arthrobacter sp. GMC3 TaxID=2058894 RepID=UPI000CE37E7A|nr:HutD family protein [Arthrobacter sp. GMC3]
MDIIRYASLKATPWANGGGMTRQLAAGFADSVTLGSGAKISNAEAWDWRISIAEVAKAGPFSPMPGMDRILTIIDGELIALTVDGAEHALEKYRTFRFSGDSQTSASLPTGALMDLNVVTRRGAFKGYATILELSKKRPHPVFAGQFAVLLQGAATVSAAPAADTSTGEPLAKLDTVVGSEDAPEISGRGFLAVVSIDPADD